MTNLLVLAWWIDNWELLEVDQIDWDVESTSC